MSDPLLPQDFLAASEAAYGESQRGYAESTTPFKSGGTPAESTLISDANGFLSQEGLSGWKTLSVMYAPQDGMYGAAYLTNGNQIVFSFEGTVENKSTYGKVTFRQDDIADIGIFHTQPTALLKDDLNFVNNTLSDNNISPDNVFVTGHSLGGLEAEYIGSVEGFGGVTFGAPGLPGYINSSQNIQLFDDVDENDPVGNYSSSHNQHVGVVNILSSSNTKSGLKPLSTYSNFTGTLNMKEYVNNYHSREEYANDIGAVGLTTLTESDDTAVDNLAIVLRTAELNLGTVGKMDGQTLRLDGVNTLDTRDLHATINPLNHTVDIEQGQDIIAPVLGVKKDAGSYGLILSQNNSVLEAEDFVDADTGRIGQLITDLTPGSRSLGVAFQSASNDTLTIQQPRLYDGVISNVGTGDVIDLPSINALSAVLGSDDTLSIQTASGTSINIQLANQNYDGDLFQTYSDGNGGTDVGIATVSASANTPTISEDAGSEQFTLTRSGDTSQAATVYVSTTDGSTVAGESVNAGNLNPFVYEPVTFAAGSSTAQVGVGINDLGLYDGSTNIYGIQVTADQSNDNVLATGQFSIVNDDPAPTISISPTDPTVSESAGSEDFTLTRAGNTTQAETVYVSTTDGTTVSGESINSGAFNPFVYQPVTFAAGSGTTQFGVTINDLGLYDGSVDNFGIKVSDAASKSANTLATTLFSTINNDAEPVTTFQYDGKQFNENPSYFPGTPAQNVTFQAGSIDADFSIAGLTSDFTGVVDKFKNDPSYTSGPYLTSIDVGVFGQQEQFEGVGQTGNAAAAILVFNNGMLDAADSQFAADFNGISLSNNGSAYDFAFSSNFSSGGLNYSNEGTFKKISS